MLENDPPFSSRPCVGNTSVPSRSVMPWPGAGAHNHHDSFLHIFVRFTGSLQVLPSSVLFTSRNCEVCFTSKPGCEPLLRHWWFQSVRSSLRPSIHFPSSLITPCIHKPAM